MLPLIQQAATNFQKANKGVSIALSAGGSGAGRSGVCKGDLNIGDSDVPLSDKEKSDLNCQSAVETNVAHQAFVVSANPQGPGKVTNLSKAQIQDIFSGKTTNWKDLGGDDQKIVVVNRTKGSGTRATMAKYLYGGDDTKFVTGASEEANNETAYQTTKQTPGAVTYLGLSYGEQSDIITFSIDNVKPTTATVKDGTWPITGPALMITKGAPEGVAKSFIDYVTGPFQADPAFNTLGFVPVK
jgi:phosphate transport system substrate-binding protein